MASSPPRPGAVDIAPLTARAGTADADAPLAKAPALAAQLHELQIERPHGVPEAGSTPLPAEWELLRAVYGGASRNDLETRHIKDLSMHANYNRALERGRLSAGLHVVTGHTGGGKTAFACALSRAAVKAGHPVVYVSLELDSIELAARLVALEAGISWTDLSLQRPLSPVERHQRDTAIKTLSGDLQRLHVWAPDPGPLEAAPTVSEVRAMVEAAARLHGKTPLVVFDYLQAPGIYGRNEEEERRLGIRERIGVITMQLRHLSKRHTLSDSTQWPGCPVLVLSTTARSNVSGRDGGPVGMTGADPDLLRNDNLETLKAMPKEAGEIEATAVTSWALALESHAAPGEQRKLTLRLAKNRRGPVGQWLPFRFDGVTGRIVDDPERYAAVGASGRPLDEDRPNTKKETQSALDLLEQNTRGTRGGP